MNLLLKFLVFIVVMLFSVSSANENFFNDAKILYEEEKYEESKFLFQRNIVFNPKDAKSYLYLAKIFNVEENEIEEEKKTIHEKLYKMATAKYNPFAIGGSESIHDFEGGSENVQKL